MDINTIIMERYKEYINISNDDFEKKELAQIALMNLIVTNYRKHHTSYHRGYVSVKENREIIEEYKGRFGKGFKVFSHNPGSTNYCFVTYYVDN